ncbi:MAG: DNA phosphorothioation-dependent restriction protein DptF, partial [Culicoidibacterales bacterium]
MDQIKSICEKYLKVDFPELYELAIVIDSQVFTNAHSVILKSRQYAEKMAGNILDLENQILQFEERNFSSMIRYLRINNIIELPIWNLFDKIRRTGNVAAHDIVNDEVGEALAVHKLVYAITVWFVETYIDQTIEAPVYKTPTPNTVNFGHTEEMLLNLLNKVINTGSTPTSNLEPVSVQREQPDVVTETLGEQERQVIEVPKVEQERPVIEVPKVEQERPVIEVPKVEQERPVIEVPKVESRIFEQAVQVQSQSSEEENTAKRSSCLLEELQKLQESSKEAVENLNGFSNFKKYMHVTRIVQTELEQLIAAANQTQTGQLILVCGSVGDGKSHLLSYLSEKGDLAGYALYNDATESFDPEKDAIDTLNDELNE